jgi:hypothetical protein
MNVMKNGALFLFIILILGLLLCSFLGGNCGKEGLENAVIMDSGVSKDPSNNDTTTTDPSNNSNMYGSTNYDNYDHYSGTSSSTTYYGPNGGKATISPGTNGASYSITVTNSNGQTTQYMIQGSDPSGNSNTSSSSFANSVSSMMAQFSGKTFYGPNGGSATVVTDNGGNYAIKIMQPDGSSVIYTPNNTYYPPSNTTTSASAGYITGPNGNSAGYITGPNGNTVVGTSTNANPSVNPYYQDAGLYNSYKNQYYNDSTTSSNSNNQYDSTMPQGVPKSMIPPGQEDLYILKSEIVPPVCPACPTSSACPRTEKCPPCPACARCPEPSFECKKVPNYNAINNSYLPVPVLSDFSSFGM